MQTIPFEYKLVNINDTNMIYPLTNPARPITLVVIDDLIVSSPLLDTLLGNNPSRLITTS